MTVYDEFESASTPGISVPREGIWRVPGERNSFFSGREKVLGDIEHHFKREGDQPAVLALVGLGGVGKTQVAAEFAWRHRKDYGVIWWLPADDSTTLALSYAQLAKHLGLRLPDSTNLDAIRHALRRALGNWSDWLLIFDNAPSVEDVRNYLPIVRSGHVLITSRDTDWEGMADVYPVRVMEREESIQFLTRRVGKREKEAVVRQVAQALGDHPLAMEQAAAHIVESRIDFSTYLKRFESHWAELLAQGTGLSAPGSEYPDSLAMSLELSFRQLEDGHVAAQAMLNLFAFFAGESIPPWVLDTAATVSEALPVNLLPVAVDRQYRAEALTVLRRYSLIEGDGENLHAHRLVSALARRRLSETERVEFATVALRIVTTAFNFDSQDPQTWAACAQVLPHALVVAEHAESLGISAESAARIMNIAGRFLMKQERLEEARTALMKALHLARKVHGPYHARLAGMSNDLGRVLQKMGDPIAAREYFEKSLRIDENIYGDDDAHAASVINNYAMTLHSDGDFVAARQYLERALSACEVEYGAAHRRSAMVRNNLACVLRDSGEAAGARAQFELALESALGACGQMHPVIARIAFNLGTLLRDNGDPQAARDLLEVALRVDRQNLGSTHPDVARDLTELAAVTRRIGDGAAASRLEEEARAVMAAGAGGAGAGGPGANAQASRGAASEITPPAGE
jgi:Tfp pilus assembly protein PilF